MRFACSGIFGRSKTKASRIDSGMWRSEPRGESSVEYSLYRRVRGVLPVARGRVKQSDKAVAGAYLVQSLTI